MKFILAGDIGRGADRRSADRPTFRSHDAGAAGLSKDGKSLQLQTRLYLFAPVTRVSHVEPTHIRSS